MKHIFSKVLFLSVLMAAFCACKDKGNTPEPQINYDKMIGSWKLESYSEKWTNMDDNIVEKDRTVTTGTLTIKKEKDNEGMQYFYTENFVSDKCEEYSGRIDINGGLIYLHASDGFSRSDGAETYDYTVSFPADNKMEWTYDWKGVHSHNGLTHQDERKVKGIFIKQ